MTSQNDNPLPEPEPQSDPSPPKTKITNENELSQNQKSAVKKLKDYSREATKRKVTTRDDKESDATEGTKESEATEGTKGTDDKKSGNEFTLNTVGTIVAIVTATLGLYYTYKTYMIEEDFVHEPKTYYANEKSPAPPKPTPKFKTL